MTDTAVTIVKFRDPRPPHGELLEVLPSAGMKYSFKIRRQGTASFDVSKQDPNIAAQLEYILGNEPPMVSIERPDGYMPWVGFVAQYNDPEDGDSVRFQCADHTWRLQAQSFGARTKKNEFYKTSGGRIIRDVFADMENRGEPAPYLKYDAVSDGPLANYEVRADYGYDVLETIAKQTNYEWGFAYNVGHGVETRLLYVVRLGVDRRNEEIWQRQRHWTNNSYTRTYANGIRSAVVVGGSGSFAARPAVVVNQSGSAPDVAGVQSKTPVSVIGLGGTRIEVTEQVTDKSVMQRRAIQMHEAPEYAVEQFSPTLYETSIDMSRFGLGDIRTIRSATLGTAIERVVRIIGIQFDPTNKKIEVEVVVVG